MLTRLGPTLWGHSKSPKGDFLLQKRLPIAQQSFPLIFFSSEISQTQA